MQLINDIAKLFVDFCDAHESCSPDQLVTSFKRDIAISFPAFYEISRFQGQRSQVQQDERIVTAISNFPQIREIYLWKTANFKSELHHSIKTFKKWFPDYHLTNEIYALHSLGEMDGGVCTLNGEKYLIFGIDCMARYHRFHNESAFYHHELFHDYHRKTFSMYELDLPPIWAALWMEGLATYVSKEINAYATDVEILLDFPRGVVEQTKKVLLPALTQLEAVLDIVDTSVYRSLFSIDKDMTGLPSRRGYYLGFLIVKEAAKNLQVRELAMLDCSEVRRLVYIIVRKSLNRLSSGTLTVE